MFKVGQIVRFKSWEQMKKEFGSDGHGNINCACIFTQEMNFLCGKEFKIKAIKNRIWERDGCERDYESISGLYLDINENWESVAWYSISNEMLMPCNINKRIS